MALVSSPSAVGHSSELVVVYDPSNTEKQEGQLIAATMDYNAYRVRVEQVKHMFNEAFQQEQDACDYVKGVQKDLMTLLTDPRFKDRKDLQDAKQSELELAEAAWRSSSLFTAELRHEIKELAKQRDGDYTDEFKFSGIHNLDHCKAIPISADQISPERKRLVTPAFPRISPSLGFNAALPHSELGEDPMRNAFVALDTEGQGYVTVKRMIERLNGLCDFGDPNFAERFIAKTLKENKLKAVDGDKLLFEHYQTLMLRWASL